MKYMKNLREIKLKGKLKKYNKENRIGDIGCKALFNNSKYLINLEGLILSSREIIKKVGCDITSKSSKVINENIKYLKKLKLIDFNCINKNKL